MSWILAWRQATNRLGLGLVLLLVLGAGCAVSKQQEIQIGQEARGQFEQEFGGLHPDSEVQGYVNRVGMSMVPYTGRADLPWEFRVVDSDEINAFALPGGFVYITKGLLQNLDNEAQLAAILGHEAGHVAHRHSVQQLQRAQVVQGGVLLAGLAGGDSAVGDVSQLVAGLALMKYGRDQEREADLAGLNYMARQGYELREMIAVMETMKRLGGSGPPEFLSSHPSPENREEYLAETIDRRYSNVITAGRTERQEFQELVVRRLRGSGGTGRSGN